MAEKGIMLGYENNFTSYCILKLESKKVVWVRDVKFNMHVFPYLKEGNSSKVLAELDVFNNVEGRNPTNQSPTSNADIVSEPTNKSNLVGSAEVASTRNKTRAPKIISSQISTDKILSVDRRGISVIVYLAKNVEKDTPVSYIQAINSSS